MGRLGKVKGSKLLIAAASLAFAVTCLCFPLGAVKAEAGSSKSSIVSSATIDRTSINSGDVFVTGKVAAEDGKILFNDQSAKQKVTTKNKAFNLKEYGVTTLLDFTSTLRFSSFAEGGKFSIAFGLNSLTDEPGAADSFALNVNYSAANNSFTLGVSEYLSDGTEQAVFAPQVAGALQLNKAVTFKVFVDTDAHLTVSMRVAGAAKDTVFVNSRELSVNPEGYISYVSDGRNSIALSDPEIIVYKYDAPETIDYTETFDNGGYNSNVFLTDSTASPITPSSLSVENGALVFKNTAAAHISTRYQYSNFQLTFDITDMAREAVFDENGNILSLINSWFGIAFGLNSPTEIPDTTTRYSTWLQVGRVFPDAYDFITSEHVGNRHYMLWDTNGDWNNVTDPQYMTDFNPWSTTFNGETINVKLTMTDGLVEYFMKLDGDPDWGEPNFSYDLGKVKTGYIRIFTAGETTVNGKGLKYNNVGSFSIDNLSIKDTDHEKAKVLLPSPEYKSNIWEKTPDYDYKTKTDNNDLIAYKIKNEDMNGGQGCSSSLGFELPVVALLGALVVLRKKK